MITNDKIDQNPIIYDYERYTLYKGKEMTVRMTEYGVQFTVY